MVVAWRRGVAGERMKKGQIDPGFGRNSWISLQNDPVLHGCVAITP